MSYFCEQCKKQRNQGCFDKKCPGMPPHDGDWQLPPLPAPDRTMWQYGKQIDHYTADQMRAFARSALNGLEAEAEAAITEFLDHGLGQHAGDKS